MDNRVKERLTGALILVAAGVILVPEIFSGKPRTDVGTDAPPAAPASEGPPLRSYTADLVGGDLGTEAPVEAAQAPAPVPAPTSTPPPAAVVTAPPRDVVAPPDPKPATPPPPSRPASTPSAASAAAPTSSRAGWYVQVGGFSQSANAERLAAQLRGQGYAVNVVPPSGGNKLTRVRVGPAPDRSAATELQQRLKSAGHAGSLVAP